MKSTRLSLLMTAAALSASAAAATTITVLVQQTVVRRRPQFYASAAATAKLGDTFEADAPTNGWYKVDGGYIQQSAVTSGKVAKLDGGSVGGSATNDEVTLAGKGFNSQVEQSYSAQNSAANFAAIFQATECDKQLAPLRQVRLARQHLAEDHAVTPQQHPAGRLGGFASVRTFGGIEQRPAARRVPRTRRFCRSRNCSAFRRPCFCWPTRWRPKRLCRRCALPVRPWAPPPTSLPRNA